jgi:hypothetical protein
MTKAECPLFLIASLVMTAFGFMNIMEARDVLYKSKPHPYEVTVFSNIPVTIEREVLLLIIKNARTNPPCYIWSCVPCVGCSTTQNNNHHICENHSDIFCNDKYYNRYRSYQSEVTLYIDWLLVSTVSFNSSPLHPNFLFFFHNYSSGNNITTIDGTQLP